MPNLYFKSAKIVHVVLLIAVCGVLFFSHLGTFPFFNRGEPREALVVLDIVHNGNWLFPLRMGFGIPSKPPLFHWVGAVTSIVRGQVTEVTVRFPSALFAALGVLLIYGLGQKIYNPNIGFLAGLILATSVGYQQIAIAARVDMTLTFFVSLSLVLFYLLYRDHLTRPVWTYVFFSVLGIGVLAKGPVSVILTGITIVCFLGLRKRWDFLYRLCIHWGLLLAVVVSLAWYGFALLEGGEEFFNRQIIGENFARFFSRGGRGSGHQGPFYYYLPYLFSGGIPWSLFFPFMILDFFKRKKYTDDGALFLMVWAMVVFVFFSLSAGKRPPYIVPLFVPLSLLTAAWFFSSVEVGRGERVAFRFLAGISIVLGLLLAVSIPKAVWDGDPMWILSAVRPFLKPGDQANLLMVKAGLARAGWLFILFLFFSSVLWFSLARNLWASKVRRLPWSLGLISALSGLLAQNVFLPSLAETKSYGPFMQEVNRLVEGRQVYIYGGSFDAGPVVFYHGSEIPKVDGSPQTLLEHLHSSSNYIIMNEEEWKKMILMFGDIPPPLLRSKGRGPDGDAHLVLVRGKEAVN